MSKYTTRNSASVMTFDIEVGMLIPEQLESAVKWLTEHDYSFEWDCVMGDSITPTKYTLRVPSMPWASNLKEFAEVLEKTDYNSDIVEDLE